MRRSFTYSVCQPSEEIVRRDVAEVIAGFPVKHLAVEPWDMGGFHIRVELDLSEDVQHVRRDVEALVRAYPGASEVVVTDSAPFADVSWEPFSTRDVCLGEYVEVRGPSRQAILWQLFGECRYCMGPAGYLKGVWSLGAYPDLRLAVMNTLAYIVDGVVPAKHPGSL